jgi:tetratricopeptide (TPR) repeat protein
MVLTPFDLNNKVRLLSLAAENSNPQLYLTTFENIRQTYQGKRIELLDLSVKKDLFDAASDAANTFSMRNIQVASQLYLSMAHFDLGLAFGHSFEPFQSPERQPPSELKKAILLLQPTESLVNYKKTLSPWLMSQMQFDMSQGHLDLAAHDVQLLLAVDEGNRWQAWNVYSEQVSLHLKQNDGEKNMNERKKLLESWYEVWKLLDKKNSLVALDFSWKKMLAEELASFGNAAYLRGEMDEAVKFFERANTIDSNFEFLVPFAFNQPNYDQAKFEAFVLSLQKNNLIDTFFHKFVLKKPVQILINQKITQKKWQLVQQLLIAFSNNLSFDYFASAQLANYYYYKGDKEAARKAYDICLNNFKNPEKETDCYWGKFDLEHETQGGELRYFRISEELLKN